MNNDFLPMAKAIFKNTEILRGLGFSKLEAHLLFASFSGLSDVEISAMLNISLAEVRIHKARCLPLVPNFIHQKLDLLTNIDLASINLKLLELNAEIKKFTNFYTELKVYQIRELKISKRLKNSLILAGIRTTKDLAETSISELVKIRSIGKKSIVELQVELSKLNIQLKA